MKTQQKELIIFDDIMHMANNEKTIGDLNKLIEDAQ